MKFKDFGGASILLAGMIASLSFSTRASGQITGIVRADGQDYFSSDSDTYNFASPINGLNLGTGLATVNAQNSLNGVPLAPAAGFPNVLTPAFSFLPPSGFGYIQVDPLPAAQRTIAGIQVRATVNPPLIPYVTAPRIQAGPFTGLHQVPGSPGYALEQFDFDAIYTVGPAGLLPAVKIPTATISGQLSNSALGSPPFAQFGYEINYYSILNNVPSLLGSAGMYQSWNTAGPIFASVTGSPSLINGFPVSTTGSASYLEVTGTMFLEGDPSSLDADVEDDIPEPASLGIAAAASMLLFRRQRRGGVR